MFGLSDDVGKPAVQEAVEKLDPLLHSVSNRLGGIFHGVLDRLNGTTIEIKVNIPPLPKATAVE
jgi:hypothetical protein